MLGIKLKQFVYTVSEKGEAAFTLLSMLMVITVLMITLPLLAYLINAVTYTDHFDELSIQQFFNFLRDELISGTNYSVSENQINFVDLDGRKVSFEKYINVILRKVDGLGHDIYLRNIQHIKFIDISYGIQVEVISQKGETYEKEIMYYK